MKILLFGATGNVGTAIAREAVNQGHELTVVVRNQQKASKFIEMTARVIVAEVSKPSSLNGICDGFDAVISTLGKSVSPNDKSKPSFYDVDFVVNSNILAEALKSGIKKMVYISAFEAEKHLNLTYFKVHHDFSEKLKASGIDYSIIKPPAIFSAFIDMIDMAKRGRLVNIGGGGFKTNPIYEGDLAKVVVGSLNQHQLTIEAGGKEIHSRKSLNEIIQREVAPDKKIRNIPLGVLKMGLPFLKIVNRNSYDKFAFFTAVMQHDTIAPRIGEMKFEDYIRTKVSGK